MSILRILITEAASTFSPKRLMCNIESTVLVDDVEAYVESGQEGQWLEIAQFANPYPDSDVELVSMLRQLQEML